jgi:hypothetical protein
VSYNAYTIGRCPLDPHTDVVVLVRADDGHPIYYCPDCGVALVQLPDESSPEQERTFVDAGLIGVGDQLATDGYEEITELHLAAPHGARWATAEDIGSLPASRARWSEIGETTFRLVEQDLAKLGEEGIE